MKKNRIHFENKRSRAVSAVIRALQALGAPATYGLIDAWCWENITGWVRMAPTPNEFGSMCAWSREIEAVGTTAVPSMTTGYSINTLWGLKEWEQ